MIVAVILSNGYPQMSARINFILQVASYALENDCLIITHEYMREHFAELKQGVAERFYREFEMRHIPKEEFDKIDFSFVPDSFFDEIKERQKIRTKTIVDLQVNRDTKIEEFIIDEIDKALIKRGEEKPEYIMNCLEPIASVRYLEEHYGCPIIPYIFSSIRMVHGYTQTLYVAHLGKYLFHSDIAQQLYESFSPDKLELPLLDKREILSILGKKRNLHLLPLLDYPGKFEVGVVGQGNHINPMSIPYGEYITDDDIYHECDKFFNAQEITIRLHPNQMDRMRFGRKHMKNDPAAFILSSKTVVAVDSQLLLKAAMWNRAICMYANTLPYSFIFSKDLMNAKSISDYDLNFILFCYMVPAKCMFDFEYWKWRMTYPTSNEIYLRHIQTIFNELGYNYKSMCKKQERLNSILLHRGCSRHEIEWINSERMKKNITYDFLSSKIQIIYSDREEYVYCLNEIDSEQNIVSIFTFDSDKTLQKCRLMLLDDIDGYVEVKSILVNGSEHTVNDRGKYLPKGESAFDIELANISDKMITLKVIWLGKLFMEAF